MTIDEHLKKAEALAELAESQTMDDARNVALSTLHVEIARAIMEFRKMASG
jgi:hypothetical protein